MLDVSFRRFTPSQEALLNSSHHAEPCHQPPRAEQLDTLKRARLWLVGRWYRCISLFAIAGSLIYVYTLSGEPAPTLADPGNTNYPWWGAASLTVGIITSLLGVLLLVEWNERRVWREPAERRKHIETLSKSLTEAMRAIEYIQSEVETGERLLHRLEAEAATKGTLARLSTEEAEAVVGLVRHEGRRSLFVGALVNAVFFGLGVLVSGLWHL